jgi:hypothetical protein
VTLVTTRRFPRFSTENSTVKQTLSLTLQSAYWSAPEPRDRQLSAGADDNCLSLFSTCRRRLQLFDGSHVDCLLERCLVRFFRDGTYRTDVAAAGKVYRQYRGRGRPRYKVQKKQNRPKDRSRSRGVVMRSQGSPRTTRPFRTGAVTKLGPLALFRCEKLQERLAPSRR